MINLIMKILVILILAAIGTGYYFRMNGDLILGDKIIGVAVLASTFILMPIFLYVRWNGKKLEDYTLSDKNIKKMKDNNRN